MRILVAPDKFRGTATAAEVAAAIGSAARGAGHDVVERPLADGGEGTLEAFGGANRASLVTGPLGEPVLAQWRLGDDGLAVIEAALACGLSLAGGSDGNDPMAATSRGVGELIAAAVAAGARRIVVGLGGSACTEGGRGALAALAGAGLTPARLAAAGAPRLVVCCDVTTGFEDAGVVFGPQKGADAAQVDQLTRRLHRLVADYRREYGVDVSTMAGAGAAGGLAGGLAAVGGELQPGFDYLARALAVPEQLRQADLVITGEGRLDETSFAGKVIGSLLALTEPAQTPVLAIVGTIDPASWPRLSDGLPRLQTLSLTEIFGAARSLGRTLECLTEATRIALSPGRPAD